MRNVEKVVELDLELREWLEEYSKKLKKNIEKKYTVECQGLFYEKGGYETMSGFKAHEKYKDGFVAKGYGWGIKIIGSDLVLKTTMGDVSIGRQCKKKIGRLYKGKRDALKETMPKTVQVKFVYGRKYRWLEVEEEDLNLWIERAKLVSGYGFIRKIYID